MKSKSTISEIRFIACAEWILDAFADKLYRLVALLQTIMVEIQPSRKNARYTKGINQLTTALGLGRGPCMGIKNIKNVSELNMGSLHG